MNAAYFDLKTRIKSCFDKIIYQIAIEKGTC